MTIPGPTPVREFMPDLPGWVQVATYAAFLVSAVVFAVMLGRRVRRSGTTWRELGGGLRAALRSNPSQVLRRLASEVLAQARVRRNTTGAWLHLSILGSFAVLTIGTGLVGLEHDITEPLFGFSFLRGDFYLGYELVLDTAALVLAVGTGIAMWRRYVTRPPHLGGRRSVHLVYALLLYFSVSGLTLEALRLLINPVPWAGWSYVGNSLATALQPVVGADPLAAYQAVWAVHVVVVFVAIAILPLIMLDHIVILPLNILLQAQREPGKLRSPFNLPKIIAAEGDLDGVTSGLKSPADLAWDRRFMLDACIDCGRCEAVCPAAAAGRPLSPRVLVQALGRDLREGVASSTAPEEDVFLRGVLDEAAAWSCVQCGACARECPALIDQPGTIVELRRNLVEQGRIGERQAALLAGLERNQNPLGLPSYQRADWLKEVNVPTLAEHPDVEYLYWIGCQASYDQRVREVAKSMIRILQHAEISFAVLGDEERCLGENQRKLGDEAGFQMRAMENIELFHGYGVRKILTHCPHCLATLTKDYPEFGADFEVVHHSVLLADLVAQGKVPAPMADDLGIITYHDPCNLGRLGGEYDAPREVVRFARGKKQFVEIGKSRDRAFCCGAGGANYFYKVEEQTGISNLRLNQAIETGADTVAVACPFCLGMLEDAARATNADTATPRIADLAELVAAALPTVAEPEAEWIDKSSLVADS